MFIKHCLTAVVYGLLQVDYYCKQRIYQVYLTYRLPLVCVL